MIEQILVTGVTSICPTTMNDVENHAVHVATFAGPFGAFVRVLGDPELERKLISQTDLLVVTAHARELGCTWVYFDLEEEPLDALPTFCEEWQLNA